jgi:hypothetical protein
VQRIVPAAVLALALLCSGRPVGGQEGAYRFEITRVNDSTFTFHVARREWVAARLRGIAVDPRRRDALIARFEVLRVANDEATALVTGQTEALTTEHVALLDRPSPTWYRRSAFWAGALLGLIVGGVIGAGI